MLLTYLIEMLNDPFSSLLVCVIFGEIQWKDQYVLLLERPHGWNGQCATANHFGIGQFSYFFY